MPKGRATYTKATPVEVRRPDGTIEVWQAYNPAELNSVISNRKPRKVRRIVTGKSTRGASSVTGHIRNEEEVSQRHELAEITGTGTEAPADH